MTYNEIFDEVKTASKRGDIDAKITAAIRAMTLYAHRTDFYWRDRIEAELSFTTASTLFEIPLLTVLPRFRQVNYLRYWDPITKAEGPMLKVIDPSTVLDEYNHQKTDRYYAAGDILKVKCSYFTTGLQIGYFANPVVSPAILYTSWIADQFPDFIIQGALAMIYNQTGKQEEARMLNKWVGIIDGYDPRNGPTLLTQLKQYALEEVAR